MNFISIAFTKVFSFAFELVGSLSIQDICMAFFDEPEVPQELIDLKK